MNITAPGEADYLDWSYIVYTVVQSALNPGSRYSPPCREGWVVKKISEEEDDPPGTDSRQIHKLDDLTQTI